MKRIWFLYRFGLAALLAATVMVCARTALALEPDQILMITNKNVADSKRLALLYAQLRGVPPQQLVELDLPWAEEMPFNTYETGVVAPVRQFIDENHLRDKIKCLLTFYGIPLRVRGKENTAWETRELDELLNQQNSMLAELDQTVRGMESQAAELDADFKPATGDSMAVLLARSQAALAATSPKVQAITDSAARQAQLTRMLTYMQSLGGDAELDVRLGTGQRDDPTKTPEDRQRWIDLHQQVEDARSVLQSLQNKRWDPLARQRLRDLARTKFGIVGGLRAVDAQIEYFGTKDTTAAVDNELALLWLDYYPREKWLPNWLNYHTTGAVPPEVMVMRMDGPDAATVERLMHTCIEVEKTGLQGIAALDARGLSLLDAKGNPNPYGQFDERIRNTAKIIRTRTELKIRLGDEDLVFPPHSVKNVGIYCGWYSVSHYIPGCDFNPGAVGYHVASYELTDLHEVNSEWVRGLMSDGVVATLGAVAEPTLGAFPPPDEFFPLLLTGKLTLAEVYWKTTPMTSWMIACIGDPLYTPYKMNPAMKLEDLPEGLGRAIEEINASSSTRPAEGSGSSPGAK